MSFLALLFGLMSGCFLSVLVGLIGSKRRIGFFARMATRAGRLVLKRRRQKGRARLTA